ncbi:hypothetical protein LguiA_035007 [Lonicera macranthoides]
MATTFNFLSDLTTEREDWIIQAIVTRKWDSINLKADNELISIDIILLDENLANLHERLNNDTHLTDVIGRVTKIGTIENQDTKIEITLWVEKPMEIDEKLLQDNQQPFTVIVTSTTVKTFKADNKKIENDQQLEQIEDTPTEVSIKEKNPVPEPYMAASSITTASLKLLIDTKSRKVLFAEADKHFVDFLFNLPCLPVGQGGAEEGGFVKWVVTYMAMDDLVVKPMSTLSSITLLNKFNIKEVGGLEEKVVNLGMDEGLKLLKTSLQSKMVLPNMFLGNKA